MSLIRCVGCYDNNIHMISKGRSQQLLPVKKGMIISSFSTREV